MSFREEWQLVAHQQDLTPAEGAVAQAIARRIRPDSPELPIPIRTLLGESVGVKSKRTIEAALQRLEALGIIAVTKPAKGSRKPSRITWELECPPECQLNHDRGNTRLSETRLERELRDLAESTPEKATRPNSEDTTRPNSEDALRIERRERSALVSFIAETIEGLPNPGPLHLELLASLDTEELPAIRAQAEQLLVKAEQNPWNYLRAIIAKSPYKLKPKPSPTQAPPDFGHLPPEVAEAQMRKLERLKSEAS